MDTTIIMDADTDLVIIITMGTDILMDVVTVRNQVSYGYYRKTRVSITDIEIPEQVRVTV